MTILAGAFGVGIGFGLQGVVNNFVCGLILLFERPIHVGDIVEIGDLLAEVRRIGIRASTVRTRQGADIIVPNAQLVTDKLTNWTLSDKLRRISLPVGVNYGAAPEKVIEVLETVARAHPRVLQQPAPYALLMSLRRQFDQLRTARLDRRVLALAPGPQRAGHSRLRRGAGGGHDVSLSAARSAPAARPKRRPC